MADLEPLLSVENDADGEHPKVGAQSMGRQLDPEGQRPGGDVAVIKERKEAGRAWCYLEEQASYTLTEAGIVPILRRCRKGNIATTIKGERFPIPALVYTEWLLLAQRR
jgi:hypothetical protein